MHPGESGPCQHAAVPGHSAPPRPPGPEQAAPARSPREASREGSGLRPAEKGPAGPESGVLRSSTQGRPGRLRREGESAPRSRGPSDRSSAGTPEQPMEASYEEVVIKVIQQEWTCLDFQQLPCWTVMEDMPRM